MIKKFLVPVALFALLLAGTLAVGTASAQTATFPAGCSSALGYSVTNGTPCNGTSVATSSIPGCSTPLGYSVTIGVPCSGGSVAISWLAGCTATTGYSTITGAPCNGTSVATPVVSVPVPPPPVTSPGLPTTGEGGNAPLNAILASVFGVMALSGLIHLIKQKESVVR